QDTEGAELRLTAGFQISIIPAERVERLPERNTDTIDFIIACVQLEMIEGVAGVDPGAEAVNRPTQTALAEVGAQRAGGEGQGEGMTAEDFAQFLKKRSMFGGAGFRQVFEQQRRAFFGEHK